MLEIRNSNNRIVHPFDPYPLLWVGFDCLKSNLAKGEWHLIDLVNEYPNTRTLAFKIPIPYSLLLQAQEKLGTGIYSFRVGVYGDNFSPVFRVFKIQLTQSFGEINFVK